MLNLPKTRASAKEAGEKFFQSENPCRKGHVAPRYTCSGACRACAQAKNKINPRDPMAMAKILVGSLRARSRKKGWLTNITPEDIVILFERQEGRCSRTGIKFTADHNSEAGSGPFQPSVDRIDSTKPYTLDNVQLVVWMYNRMKGEHTTEEFAELLSMIPGVHVNEDLFCSPK